MKLPFDPNQPYQLDAVATVADLFDGQSQGAPEYVIVHVEDNGRPHVALRPGILQLPPHLCVSPLTHRHRRPDRLCMMVHAILGGLTSMTIALRRRRCDHVDNIFADHSNHLAWCTIDTRHARTNTRNVMFHERSIMIRIDW